MDDKHRVNICHFLSSHLLICTQSLAFLPTYGCALVQLEWGGVGLGVLWGRNRRRGIGL